MFIAMRIFRVACFSVPFLAANGVHIQAPLSLPNDDDPRAVLTPEIDRSIETILLDWNSPGGIAVAVVRQSAEGDWNIETKGYGIAKADGSPVTRDTLFCIGSNSKLFTVLGAGLLISNESLTPRISWTTKVASIVPEWELMDPISSSGSTIVDLMSHRTGLPRHDSMYAMTDSVPDITKRLKDLKPSAEWRDVWQYNNIAYMILSRLPTLLLPSQIPFTRYIKEHIFDRLGMNSTTYSSQTAAKSGNLADGFARQNVNVTEDPFGRGIVRPLPYWFSFGGEDGNFISGAGGVISNAVDMATWLQTLLLEGQHPLTNESVIPVDVVRKAASGITVQGGTAMFPELAPVVYGGGQGRSSYRGHEYIEHGGSTRGFKTQIIRFPDENLGIAVLSNDEMYGSYLHETIKFRLADKALKLEPIDWNARFKRMVINAQNSQLKRIGRSSNATLPSVNFSALAGKYTNPGYGELEFCLFPVPPSASPACQGIDDHLPGALDPSVPTLLAKWDRVRSSHLKIAHYDGDLFNVSALVGLPTGDSDKPYWVSEAGAFNAEFVPEEDCIGFGLFGGIWGAEEGVEAPTGKSVRDRAEVWFDKI